MLVSYLIMYVCMYVCLYNIGCIMAIKFKLPNTCPYNSICNHVCIYHIILLIGVWYIENQNERELIRVKSNEDDSKSNIEIPNVNYIVLES